MDRSLLVDVIAPHLQPAATAWASRMFGVGGELEVKFDFYDSQLTSDAQ